MALRGIWPALLLTLGVHSQSLKDLVGSRSNLSSLDTALKAYPNLYDSINAQLEPITVFAPSNAAFEKIPYQIIGPAFSEGDQGGGNPGAVRAILEYHVASGRHPSTSFNGSFQFLHTMLKNESYTNVTDGQVIAVVMQAGNTSVAVTGVGSRSTLEVLDVPFDNGVLHIIDTVLIPPLPFLQSAPAFNLTSLPGALLTTEDSGLPELVETTKDITIFAPSTGAMAGLGATLSQMSANDLQNLLEYHIVVPSGGSGHAYNSAYLPNGALYPNGTNSTTLRSLAGDELTISFARNALFINSAQIIQQDLLLSNGILHIIDNVLNRNASMATADPNLPTQAPVIAGSALPKNQLPFTSELPTSTSVPFSLVTANPTDTAFTGALPTSYTPTLGSMATTTSRADAGGVEAPASGVLLASLFWLVGYL